MINVVHYSATHHHVMSFPRSTGNALEELAFQAKDSVFVVVDVKRESVSHRLDLFSTPRSILQLCDAGRARQIPE